MKDKKQVYDFTNFFYDKIYIEMKNHLFNYLNRKRLIKFYSMPFVKKMQKILDVGCGTSPVTPISNKTLFIDISKEALTILEKKGYKTAFGSVTKIPLENNSVDAVFCSEVLEHVKDYKKGLEEISRVLKKNGMAFITVPCWENYWNIDDGFVGHYRRFEPNELIKELNQKRLKVIKIKKIGSILERTLTTLAVKRFKSKKQESKIPMFIFIPVNYMVSLVITLSTFVSSYRKSSILLFICKKE